MNTATSTLVRMLRIWRTRGGLIEPLPAVARTSEKSYPLQSTLRRKGCCCWASAKSLRRFSLDSPCHLVISSGPLTGKKRAPDSWATALARRVLPHPGGSYSRTPRWGARPGGAALRGA